MGLFVDDALEQGAGDRRDRLAGQSGQQEVLDDAADLVVAESAEPSTGHPHDLDHRPVAIGRHTEPRADAVGDVDRGEAFASDLLGEEVLGDELLQVATDLVLALGDDRGVRDRQPSGCRKSAVTANQSASAPTIAASAPVLT